MRSLTSRSSSPVAFITHPLAVALALVARPPAAAPPGAALHFSGRNFRELRGLLDAALRAGGTTLAAPEAVRILDAAGNDVVIVETVGVGQAEVDVAADGFRARLARDLRIRTAFVPSSTRVVPQPPRSR